MSEEMLTYISTYKASKLYGKEQGGLRKILRTKNKEGKKRLTSTIFIINKKARHFIEKKEFRDFLRIEIDKLSNRLEHLINSEFTISSEIEEEMRNEY